MPPGSPKAGLLEGPLARGQVQGEGHTFHRVSQSQKRDGVLRNVVTLLQAGVLSLRMSCG